MVFFKKKFFARVGKRQRFILATFLLSLLFTTATFFSFEWLLLFIPLISLAVYAMTYYAILEGITKHERLMLFIHPIYFALVFYLFYFFVPQRWLTRIPFITIYVIAMYAIMLSQNIFNVGVSKSLQLYRAAFSVNYLFLTICSFIAYSLIISLRLHAAFNMVLIFCASFPLVLHMLWTVEPKEHIEKELVGYSLFLSLLLSQMGVILSFVPINQSIYALVITSLFYSLTGLFSTNLQNALYREKVREYLMVFSFALVMLFLTIKW